MARASSAKQANQADPSTLTRQRLRTRGLLLRSARRVFERRGYHNTRINDITDEAKVSVGTFYTYFGSKEDIFRNLLTEIEDEVYGELAAHRSQSRGPRESISETNRLYLEAFHRNARFWSAIAESALTDDQSRQVLADRRRYYHARTRKGIVRWREQGAISIDLDEEVTAAALGAMTERCAYLWFVFGDGVDITVATEQLTHLWLSALGLDVTGEV